MHLVVDEAGMGIRVNLDTENNSEARALYSAVERGDISGMSFMFAIRGEKWEELDSDHPVRRITDISTVVEVSAVTFPAYEATTINARGKEALENAQVVLENARKAKRDKNSVDTEIEVLKLKTMILGG